MASGNLSLSSLVGQDIYAKIPAWQENRIVTIRLVGVDTGGIWIESRDFMENFFQGTSLTMTSESVQVFVPYSQILAIYRIGGGPWISEKVAQ
jgi:hypothetical protein